MNSGFEFPIFFGSVQSAGFSERKMSPLRGDLLIKYTRVKIPDRSRE